MTKRIIVCMMAIMTAMFTGCSTNKVNYEKEAQLIRAYMEENWNETDCFIAAEKIDDRWLIHYRFRINGLKNDRWFLNQRIVEVVGDDVVLINNIDDIR